MKIKLFEEFGKNSRLDGALKTICDLYAEECDGGAVHPSEYFDDNELRELTNEVQDDRIKSILNNMADCCLSEYEGNAEHLCDWMSDDDCNCICDYLGMDRMF